MEEQSTGWLTTKSWPESSNITDTSYDAETEVLTVTFKNKSSYDYTSVPPEIWEQLYRCDSIGSFIAKHIRGKFNSTKL